MGLFVAECLNNDVKYFPGGTEFSLEDGNNIMLAKLMSVVNAYYAEITSKKVRLANARKAKEGKTHGLKPYGYKKGKTTNMKFMRKRQKRATHVSAFSQGSWSLHHCQYFLTKREFLRNSVETSLV